MPTVGLPLLIQEAATVHRAVMVTDTCALPTSDGHDHRLLEDGENFLLEDGNYFLLESSSAAAEQARVVVALPSVESVSLTLTEITDHPTTTTFLVTDNLALGAAESAPVAGEVPGTQLLVTSDTGVLGCVEAFAPTATHPVTTIDTLGISAASEAVSIFGFTPQQTQAFSVSDTCAIHLGEQAVRPVVTDALTLVLTDTVRAVATVVQASDSVGLPSQDTLSRPTLTMGATDTLALRLTEPEDQASAVSTVDVLLILASEGAIPAISGALPVTASDSLACQLTESSPGREAVQQVGASETISATVSEGGLLMASVVSAAEALGCSVNEAASLLFRVLAVTDAAALPMSEAVSIFTDFIAVATAETVGLPVVDAVVLLQTLLTQLVVTESMRVNATDDVGQATSTVQTEETLSLTAVTEWGLTRSLASEETVAVALPSESANVINPFVINVFLSVTDTVPVVGVEALAAAAYHLLADDTGTVQLGEAALVESLALADIWDGANGTDYAMSQPDPISYRIGSKAYW